MQTCENMNDVILGDDDDLYIDSEEEQEEDSDNNEPFNKSIGYILQDIVEHGYINQRVGDVD